MKNLLKFLFVALLLATSGCAKSHDVAVSQDERAGWATLIERSKNLYRVDALLFRSAQPEASDDLQVNLDQISASEIASAW